MNNNKPSYFSIITAAVRYDSDLPPNAKLLYSEISALCNLTGECWAENEYFAKLYNKETETISRWISALKRNGHIEVKIARKKGNKRAITLLTKKSIPIDKKVNTLLTKKSIPIDKKVNSYIRNNNTINNTRENKAFSALEFLQENYEFRFEQEFLMRYKSKIKNFEKFCEDFNDTIVSEKREFDAGLFGRLGKYARNWIQNQDLWQKPEAAQPIKRISNGI